MRRPRSVSRDAVIATALAGTIAGHWLAYVGAFRDPAARQGALASTGHSWLHLGREARVGGDDLVQRVARDPDRRRTVVDQR